VFLAALTRASELRGAFLDEACGGDDELRREVDGLLAAHEAAGGFLSSPIGLDTDGAEEAGAPDAGPQRIGPYQVLDTIAQGGMGTVYRAVRDDDAFRKTVALKLVRGGRHSDYFEQRFRQERQILAGLQHPNIATVLDGGTAEDGQPYLVMEYVAGQPITGFCAAQGMGTRERVALFRTVCGAVQYAHQNLVVHRDIKPANVLVDGQGVPKLLDFGIAKLLASGVERLMSLTGLLFRTVRWRPRGSRVRSAARPGSGAVANTVEA
jgi:serine/threonine protein kinase